MAQQNQHNSLNNNIVYYRADIVNTSDYGAWGDPLPQRGYSSSAYKYGFNGKEKLDELNGEGNIYDYGMRIYDPRVGRWLSQDPATKHFPELSTYSSFANNPIHIIDNDGDYIIIHYKNIFGKEKTLQFVPGERHILKGSFVRETERALNYLHKQDVKGLISKFSYDTKHHINLSYSNEPGEKFTSSRTSNIIKYNPLEGQRVYNEINQGLQSPALRLYHEIAHQYIRQFDKKFKLYNREELEQKVIDEYENFIAEPLGEPQRQTHNATEVEQTSVQYSTQHSLWTKKDEEEFQKQVDKDIESGMFEKKESKNPKRTEKRPRAKF